MARTRRIKNKRKFRTNGNKRKSRPNYNTKRINKRRTKRRINKKIGGSYSASTTSGSGYAQSPAARTAYRQARKTKFNDKAAALATRRRVMKENNPPLTESLSAALEAAGMKANPATKFAKERLAREKAAEKAAKKAAGKAAQRKTRSSCCSSRPRRS